MQLNKWWAFTVAALFFGIALLAYTWWVGIPATPSQELVGKCYSIVAGMNRDEVLLIMAEPKSIFYAARDTMTVEMWFYHSSRIASSPVQCSFDSSTGKVIGVLCGD